jgi:hypothetical protein
MSWGQTEPGGSYLSSSEWNDFHSGIGREEPPHSGHPIGHIARHDDCPLTRGQVSMVAVDLDCNRVDVGRVGNRCNAAAITKEIEPSLEVGVCENRIQELAGFVFSRGPINHICDQSNSPINGEVNAHDTPASISPCCLDNFRRIGPQTQGVKKMPLDARVDFGQYLLEQASMRQKEPPAIAGGFLLSQAEREGFEPSYAFRHKRFSRP